MVGDTRGFLAHILPAVGYYVISVMHGTKLKNYVYDDIEPAVRAIREFDKNPNNQVFHACASYAASRPTGMRTQNNVLAIQSVWVDLDCGNGKDYPTPKAAGLDLQRVCNELQLPFPTLVKSGKGLHAYWVFDTPLINKDSAQVLVGQAKKALQKVGLKLDPSRTGDLASILRPAGAHWRKETPEREVKLVRMMTPMSVKEFRKRISCVVSEDEALPTKRAVDTGEFGVEVEYPPSNAKKVIVECAAIKHIAELRGDVEEPLWYAGIGTLSYTTQGFKAGHVISRGYHGYSEAETQERMERWQNTCNGPATCEKFRSIKPELCSGCPHKVTTPLQLGHVAEVVKEHNEVSVEGAVLQPEEASVSGETPQSASTLKDIITIDEELRKRLPEELPYWKSSQLGERYRVAGNTLQAKEITKNDDGEEEVSWLNLIPLWLYPYRTKKNADGERTVECWLRKITMRGGAKVAMWEVIEFAGDVIADTNTLMRALGKFGVYESSALSRKVRPMIKQYLYDTIRAMEDYRGEVDEFDRMGWTPGEENFIIGESVISGGVEYPAIVSPQAIPLEMSEGLKPEGSIAEWRRTVEHVYGGKAALPYQFVIASAFAAPLVALAGLSDFHGIPIAITGEGANGKTTVAQVACSVYGSPNALYAGGGEAQATTNALLSMVSKVRNLPFLFDEVTSRNPTDMQTILYAISNGRPKLRLQRDGHFQDSSKMTWDTITYVTSNEQLTDVLARSGDTRVTDATQVRVFEIHMADHYASKSFSHVDPHDLQDILTNHYGAVGREYLKFLTKHQADVRRVVEKMRRKVLPTQLRASDMKERFYRELIALTLAGAHIAKKLGLLPFEVADLKDWALDHVANLRVERASAVTTAQDVLARFLSENSDRIVHTAHFPEGRGAAKDVELVSDAVRKPIGRIAREPSVVCIEAAALDNWLKEKQFSPTWFRNEAMASGLLLKTEGRPVGRKVIYRGTDLANAGMRIPSYNFAPGMVLGGDITPPLEVIAPSESVS